MNKKGFLKVLMICLALSMAIGLLAGNSMGQVISNQVQMRDQNPVLIGTNGLPTANIAAATCVLVDNFEYFNTPRNMGWTAIEPPYPQFGYGLGYGSLQTVLDFEEGSRVLDVYREASVFLFTTQFETYQIRKVLPVIPSAFSMVSFKVRAPFSVEQFDMFRFAVLVAVHGGNLVHNAGGGDIVVSATTPASVYRNGESLLIEFIPRENGVGSGNNGLASATLVQPPNGGNPGLIRVNMGMQFTDGTWHLVMEDLSLILRQVTTAGAVCSGLASINGVQVTGNMYRLDDIILARPETSTANNSAPYLFHIGPVYATLWDVQGNMGQIGYPANPLSGLSSGGSRFIIAEDIDLGITMNANGTMPSIVDLDIVPPGVIGTNAEMYNYQSVLDAIASCPACTPITFNPRQAVLVGYNVEPGYSDCPPGNIVPLPNSFKVGPNCVDCNAGNLAPLNAAAYPTVPPFPFVPVTLDIIATVGDALGPQSQNLIRSVTLPNMATSSIAAVDNFLITSLPAVTPSMADGSRPLQNRTLELMQRARQASVPLTMAVAAAADVAANATGATAASVAAAANTAYNGIVAEANTSPGSYYAVAAVLSKPVNDAAAAAAAATGATAASVAAAARTASAPAGTGAGQVAENPVYVVACALFNAGYRDWPGLGILVPAQGQVLEDLIVTCRVNDGMATDMETFPVSVVNYPVNNNAPIINQLEDQFFAVSQNPVPPQTIMLPNLAGSTLVRNNPRPNSYRIVATDPDPQDQALLTYKATLDGLPSYQIGPYFGQIINPQTGEIAFTPLGEGALTCMVTVSDPRGMMAIGHFTIFCVNPGTMLNHAPAVLEIIESPQIAAAGDLFTISDLRIADPDGEPLYYSCNIGAVGRNGLYSYQCNFPGTYLVQITAYDIRGGAVTQQFVLEVLPWWSI